MKPPELITAGDLVLKRWEPRWAGEASAAVRDSVAELRPFLNWVRAGYTTDESLAFIERTSGKWTEVTDFNYALFTAAGEFAGSLGLMTRPGPGVLEIGYWMSTAFTGRGYMTAAVDALAGVALTLPGVDRVVLRHDVANAASGAVAAKAGFIEIGREPCEPEAPGETGTDVIRERRA